ncbi:hypothetical protein HY440_01755 [Candidatus Microgenomates bacterium]|nr:hypothetical protein [Candidatus Microgenomates bacterium]
MKPELWPLWQDGERLVAEVPTDLTDYSFLVFPFAKVYEGFLKKLFLAIGAISQQQYDNDRWRVGRALNPQLEREYRHVESVYDRLVEFCQGPILAQTLWEAWKRGRNQVFHFWPGRSRTLILAEAREIIASIERAMEMAMTECKI